MRMRLNEVRQTKRKISPLVYSIALWIVGSCLLLSEVALTITFVYMLLAIPLMLFFVWQEGEIVPEGESKTDED